MIGEAPSTYRTSGKLDDPDPDVWDGPSSGWGKCDDSYSGWGGGETNTTEGLAWGRGEGLGGGVGGFRV